MTYCAAKKNIFLFSIEYNAGGNDAFDNIRIEFRILDESNGNGFAYNLGGYTNG